MFVYVTGPETLHSQQEALFEPSVALRPGGRFVRQRGARSLQQSSAAVHTMSPGPNPTPNPSCW